jgi:DUF4097 and DUF4098 domain-containing protein YvlB
MKVDRGSIHVNSSATDKVDVKVVREVKRVSEEKAKEIIEQHHIEMAENSGSVTITAENPQQKKLFGNNPFNHLQVSYTISVPAKYDLDVRTAGGNIEVSDLEGNIEARTAGGDVKLGAITGPVKAHTAGGNIILKGSKGDADVHTSGGDLRIGEVEGNLMAKTSGGNIKLERVTGRVDAQTSGGDVHVNEAYGPVMARTSGGNVSAKLNEQPKGDCALKTSGGNVELMIPEKLALDVRASTSGGSIRSDFPGEMNKSKTRMTAQLNGGGPEMVLETSGGNVNIRRK